jgi:hypothetical protein
VLQQGFWEQACRTIERVPDTSGRWLLQQYGLLHTFLLPSGLQTALQPKLDTDSVRVFLAVGPSVYILKKKKKTRRRGGWYWLVLADPGRTRQLQGRSWCSTLLWA